METNQTHPYEMDVASDSNSDSRMHPVQRQIYQSMTPARKLEVALSLYYSARRLKAAAFRARYPHLSDDEIEDRVKEAFLYART